MEANKPQQLDPKTFKGVVSANGADITINWIGGMVTEIQKMPAPQLAATKLFVENLGVHLAIQNRATSFKVLAIPHNFTNIGAKQVPDPWHCSIKVEIPAVNRVPINSSSSPVAVIAVHVYLDPIDAAKADFDVWYLSAEYYDNKDKYMGGEGFLTSSPQGFNGVKSDFQFTAVERETKQKTSAKELAEPQRTALHKSSSSSSSSTASTSTTSIPSTTPSSPGPHGSGSGSGSHSMKTESSGLRHGGYSL